MDKTRQKYCKLNLLALKNFEFQALLELMEIGMRMRGDYNYKWKIKSYLRVGGWGRSVGQEWMASHMNSFTDEWMASLLVKNGICCMFCWLAANNAGDINVAKGPKEHLVQEQGRRSRADVMLDPLEPRILIIQPLWLRSTTVQVWIPLINISLQKYNWVSWFV